MPPDIVAKIARDAAVVLKDPEFKADVLDQNGLDAIGDSPSEFAQFLANSFATQRDQVKAINMTLG
jgi:tripartite-type tricarboxylate transporter receptor subunit TctC